MKKLLSMTPWIVAAVCFPLGMAHAADETSNPAPSALRAMAGIMFTGGGENLTEVKYASGDTQTITSGGMTYLYGGLEFYMVGTPLALQATVGVHFDSTRAASNGDVTFHRIPFELSAIWIANDKIRLGAGVRYASNARLSSSGVVAGIGNYNFDSSTGFVVKGEYMLSPMAGIELRYVDEKYRLPGSGSFDGSHAGLGLNLHF